MKDFDPFGAQKQQSFTSSLKQIVSIGTFLTRILESSGTANPEAVQLNFEHLVLVSIVGYFTSRVCDSGMRTPQQRKQLSIKDTLLDTFLVVAAVFFVCFFHL